MRLAASDKVDAVLVLRNPDGIIPSPVIKLHKPAIRLNTAVLIIGCVPSRAYLFAPKIFSMPFSAMEIALSLLLHFAICWERLIRPLLSESAFASPAAHPVVIDNRSITLRIIFLFFISLSPFSLSKFTSCNFDHRFN